MVMQRLRQFLVPRGREIVPENGCGSNVSSFSARGGFKFLLKMVAATQRS
jgi:hypothetical protein